MEAVIFDIDGTLFDMPAHIWQSGPEFNWDEFLEWMDGQQVIHNAWQALSGHWMNDRIVVAVTARPEKYRDETEALLAKLGVPFDHVIMRPDEMLTREWAEIDGHTCPEAVKRIIHKHHAIWRTTAVDEIKERIEDAEVVAAYDDQINNLDVWKEHYPEAELWHVNKGKLVLLVEEDEAEAA